MFIYLIELSCLIIHCPALIDVSGAYELEMIDLFDNRGNFFIFLSIYVGRVHNLCGYNLENRDTNAMFKIISLQADADSLT